MPKKIAIIGAGPAGLTAAYLLGKANENVTVLKKTLIMLVVSPVQKHTKAITLT